MSLHGGAIAIDPLTPATIYVGACSQGSWKSADCGGTYVHINIGTNGSAIAHGREWTFLIDLVETNTPVARRTPTPTASKREPFRPAARQAVSPEPRGPDDESSSLELAVLTFALARAPKRSSSD